MPLAHPQRISISHNYSRPVAVVSFATSKPGEDVDDFYARINDRQLPWGANGRGRHVMELALTRDGAEELVRMLMPIVGRSRIGEIIDSA